MNLGVKGDLKQEIFNEVNENVRALERLFPSVVKDGQVDFEALKEEFSDITSIANSTKILGKDSFLFAFMSNSPQIGWEYHKNKGLEPYGWHSGNTLDLKSGSYGCTKTGHKQYCTAVIQENNWKIPKDYPVRF